MFLRFSVSSGLPGIWNLRTCLDGFESSNWRHAISGFILLGVFLFVLRVAEDRYLISHRVESSLIFLACVTALTLTVFGCIRVVNSRTIRIALLFLLLAICTELILSVTGRIDAWNEIPIIGWAQRNSLDAEEFVLRVLVWRRSDASLSFASYEQVWTDDDKRLVKDIGRRIEDALTSLLSLRELRVSEDRYRTLFEHAPEAILVHDIETNRFVDWNKNALEMLKIEAEDLAKLAPQDVSAAEQPHSLPPGQFARLQTERLWRVKILSLNGYFTIRTVERSPAKCA